MQNLQRVRRYQHVLEDAEGRAEQAESSLQLIRAKHRSGVVTGKNLAPSVRVVHLYYNYLELYDAKDIIICSEPAIEVFFR